MKKVIAVAVFLLAALLLLGPFYGGVKAEKELRAAVEKFSAYPGYQLAWVDYQRDWFSTKATLSVGFDFGALAVEGTPAPQWPELPLSIHIAHGPLLLDAGELGWYSWRLRLTEDQNAWLEEHLTSEDEEQLYQARGHIGLLGAVEHQDELQPFSIVDSEAVVTFNFNGYSGSMQIDGKRRLDYKGVIKGMDLTAQDFLLAMGNTSMSLNGDLSRLDWDTFLYPSDFFVNIASLQMQEGDQMSAANNVVVEGALEMPEGQDWFSIITSLSAGQIAAHDVSITDAMMTLAYEQISLAAYQAYMDMVLAVTKSPQDPLAYQQFFTPEVMQAFFAKGPSFSLRNLSFTMPEGDFKSSFQLAIPEGVAIPDQLANPLMLLQVLSLTANAEVDKSLAHYLAKKSSQARAEEAMAGQPGVSDDDINAAAEQQAQSLIAMLTEQGIAVEDGEDLKVAMEFLNGQLLLNGKPMPLPLDMLMSAQ